MKIVRHENASRQFEHGVPQPDGGVPRLAGDIGSGYRDTGEPATAAKLFAPLAPTAILCIGLHYRKHAVVIGKKGKNIVKADALDYVLGDTCANDVYARDWQKNFDGSQGSHGKFFRHLLPAESGLGDKSRALTNPVFEEATNS